MHDIPENFYGPIGKELKAWWVTVEKYGFHNLLEETDSKKNERPSEKHEDLQNESTVCIEDPFVNGETLGFNYKFLHLWKIVLYSTLKMLQILFLIVDAEDIEVIIEGDERLHGTCIVKLKSGHVLSGQFVKGRRKGPGKENQD